MGNVVPLRGKFCPWSTTTDSQPIQSFNCEEDCQLNMGGKCAFVVQAEAQQEMAEGIKMLVEVMKEYDL